MFLQVGIKQEDRRYHIFLWREEPTDEMKNYEFNRVVFGVKASPFLASKAVTEVVTNFGAEYGLYVTTAIDRSFYVMFSVIFLPVPIMPRVVFTDDLEKKLIEIWAEYQRNETGKMMKRSLKKKEIASAVNQYARELYGESREQDLFTATMVYYKIDNL